MKKLIPAVLCALLSAHAFGAIDATNSAVGSASSVTVSDSGSAPGDELILVVIVNGYTSATVTWPSGFTQFVTASNSGGSYGAATFMAAAAGTTRAPSYTISVSQGTTPAAIFASASGRTTGTPTRDVGTNNIAGGAVPISIGLTGVTAVAGDDLLWVGVANTAISGNTWSFTAPTGFTSQQTVNNNTSPGYGGNLSIQNNVAAGATGTITGTATNTYASASSSALGIVVAIPKSAAASCTNQGWNHGAFTVPTAGTTLVWLKNGTFGTTDCASTQYWQKQGGFGAN